VLLSKVFGYFTSFVGYNYNLGNMKDKLESIVRHSAAMLKHVHTCSLWVDK
jgi:hypothetical protein